MPLPHPLYPLPLLIIRQSRSKSFNHVECGIASLSGCYHDLREPAQSATRCPAARSSSSPSQQGASWLLWGIQQWDDSRRFGCWSFQESSNDSRNILISWLLFFWPDSRFQGERPKKTLGKRGPHSAFLLRKAKLPKP